MGKKGGKATLKKHGLQHMSKAGKKGGHALVEKIRKEELGETHLSTDTQPSPLTDRQEV